MNIATDLEKKINSELGTKVKSSAIKHQQIYITINIDDLVDVATFLKTNQKSKFKQLIDITAIDYPEQEERFCLVYHYLSMQQLSLIHI